MVRGEKEEAKIRQKGGHTRRGEFTRMCGRGIPVVTGRRIK